MTTALAIIGGFTVLRWAWVLGKAFIEGYSGNSGYYHSEHSNDLNYAQFEQ